MSDSPIKYSYQQKSILFATLFFISILYFISSCYINTSNDGSHFALVSALVNKHTVVINDFIEYTGKVDYAVKDGVYYSDRLPGNAFLMIPFFAFGNFLELVHLNTFSSHVPIQEVTVILLPNLCGVLGVVFMFFICTHFNASFKKSLFVSLIYGLCTLNMQESTHVFSHAPSMCLVLAAFYYLLITPDIYDKRFFIFILLLSYSVIVELQNLLLFLPALVYIFQKRKIDFKLRSKNLKVIILSSLIIVGTLSVLMIYNYIAFGELTLKSNKFNPEFPEEKQFLTSLSGDFFNGMDLLFTNLKTPELWFDYKSGVKNDIPGLFITSPILLIALCGFIPFYKKFTKEVILFSLIIIINVLIAAFHKTVLVRHIFTITPFLTLPILFAIDFVQSNKNRIFTSVFTFIFLCLSVFSLFRVFYVTHTYWGRDISIIFPFMKEIKIYMLFLIFISVIYFLFYFLNKIKLQRTS